MDDVHGQSGGGADGKQLPLQPHQLRRAAREFCVGQYGVGRGVEGK